MRFEMLQLTEILYYEGQKERTYFKLSNKKPTDSQDIELSLIRALNAGYVNLFYERSKSDAYKYFYQAYQLAKELDNPVLLKASLLAFFKYYNFEVAQISDSYKVQLDHFESLKEDYIDGVWLTLYKMIFYSKVPMSLGKLDSRYYELAKSLDEFENHLNQKSPVLTHIFYEKAIKFEIEADLKNCNKYLKKVIEQAKEYAKTHQISLSRLIESYLSSLVTKKDRKIEITPLVESLSGVIELENDFNYKVSYTDYLIEKYK